LILSQSAPEVAARPVRRLDRKLAAIIEGREGPDDFVLADAKDADMASGVTAAGPLLDPPDGDLGPGRYRTRQSYLAAMQAQASEGLVDILLASASNAERLAAAGSLPDDLTLAVRANDTSEIWLSRSSTYRARPSRPFRSADLVAIRPFCDLVLYSVTFNNDVALDLATSEAYREFRIEAEALGMRHFLEVFNPNAPLELDASSIPGFVNDSIIRTLAGVTTSQRPLFLKTAFNGTAALAELVEHDRSLAVGILGGGTGTTRDTYELLQRVQAHGARLALFGRKIQYADSQLDLVRLMPPVLRGELSPADAVRAYHRALAADGCTPRRSLEADLQITDPVLLAE
jgi:hypothetical protein